MEEGGTNLTNCNRAYIIFTYFLIIGVIACESSDTFLSIFLFNFIWILVHRIV